MANLMLEYCISAGEGTLMDYGCVPLGPIEPNNPFNAGRLGWIDLPGYADDGSLSDLFPSDVGGGVYFDTTPRLTVMVGPASPECQTGK